MTIPERTIRQRLDALEKANAVRSYRKGVKADIYAGRRDTDEVLVSDDPRLASMYVSDLLLATPGLGKTKLNNWFRQFQISPSKTVGGLSPRQRARLLIALRSHRARSGIYQARRAMARG